MNRKDKLIETLVSQFANEIRKLPEKTLNELKSGKLEISFTKAVGDEAGGILDSGTRTPTAPMRRRIGG